MTGIEPPTVRDHAPDAGEHTDEVLREAGLSAEEISDMRQRNVV